MGKQKRNSETKSNSTTRKMPLTTFRNLSKEKQERITRIATEEFSTKGYARASINAIVQRLGIAKGSIFQYFGDKKGLFLFIFQASMEKVKDHLRKVRDQTRDQDLASRLVATLQAGVEFSNQHPVIYGMYIKIMFEYDIPFRNEILSSLRQYSIRYLNSLLEDARIREEIRNDLNPDIICFILDAVMDRFLQARMVPHLDGGLGIHHCTGMDSEKWIRQIVDILLKGIGQ